MKKTLFANRFLYFAAVPAINVFLVILFFGRNLVFHDQWMLVYDLEKYFQGNLSFEFLNRFHNEHRLFFPRICMLFLALISDWNTRWEMLFSFSLALAAWALLWHRYCSFNLGKEQNYLSALIFALLLFSISQNENWLWGWQIQIFLNVLMVTIGFHFLVSTRAKESFTFLLAIFFCIAACFSFANGLAVWPIGLIYLIVFKRKLWQIVLWSFVSIFIILYYFHDYQRPIGHPEFHLLKDLPNSILYCVVYLGAPIFHIDYITKLVSGVMGVLLFTNLLFEFQHSSAKNLRLVGEGKTQNSEIVKKGRITKFFGGLAQDSATSAFVFWLCLGAYAMFSAVITAAGRVGFGFQQASASRYITIANLFWVMLFAVYLKLYHSNLLRFELKYYRWALNLLIILLVSCNIRGTIIEYESDSIEKSFIISNELKKENPDTNIVKQIVSSPKIVLEKRSFLEKHRYSFYK